MTQLGVTDANSESVVPPEEKLTKPPAVTSTESAEISTESAESNKAEQESSAPAPYWLVVAKNRRVNRDWELLLLRAPENARRCYEDLCTAPMVRKPGRVFPLKGKRYRGAWEYEVTGAERVFYVPDLPRRKVVVYYAGEHPKNAPTPP